MMVKNLFPMRFVEMVSFSYRPQTKLASTSIYRILRNYLNSKEHSIVFVRLKAKVEKMKKRGTDFRLVISLVWLGSGTRGAEETIYLIF